MRLLTVQWKKMQPASKQDMRYHLKVFVLATHSIPFITPVKNYLEKPAKVNLYFALLAFHAFDMIDFACTTNTIMRRC